MQTPIDTAIIDLDGTLIDSTYHHTLAWSRAFAEAGLLVETWRIHQLIGMGGDRLVPGLVGQDMDARCGDSLRERHRQHYEGLFHEVAPLDGARELLDELDRRGFHVTLATSGEAKHTRWALRLLGYEDPPPYTSSTDAEHTKPSPELLDKALEKVSGKNAVVIGDSVWDVEAARRRGFPAIGLCSGGISPALLQKSGAIVYQNPRELLGHLDAALHRVGAHGWARAG